MKNHSDRLASEYLILQAQEGDATALEALLKAWQKRLWALACSLTNRDVAHDVLQESMCAIARGIRGLEDPACFKSWAYRIVSNKSRDWIRANDRRHRLESSVSEASFVEEDDSVVDRIDCLQVGLSALPADQRGILKLFYLEGMSVSEIAVVLSIPEGTVKSRLFTARGKLKRLMRKDLLN